MFMDRWKNGILGNPLILRVGGGFSLIHVNMTEIIMQMDEPCNPGCEEENHSALAGGCEKH